MRVTAGSVNKSVYVYFVDDDGGTAPGEPTTGLLFSDIETGGSASYARQGAARVDVTLKTLASASAAHDDGGFILVDDTNMPGLYRVDIPDAAFAAGVDFVIIHMVAAGANNSIMRPLAVDIRSIPEALGGYAGPRGPGVYYNDAASNTTSIVGVDGTIDNPNSTIAAAKATADAMSLDRIYIVNDSAITLAATMTDYEFVGIGAADGNTVALASQDVDGSAFYNVTIAGVQGGAARAYYDNCILGIATLHCLAYRCGLSDSATGLTVSNNDDQVFDQCWSMVAGNATPILIVSGANADVMLRHYSGGIELKTLHATSATSVETDGQVIFNADCNVNASVSLRGNLTVTDNTAGMNNLTRDAALSKSYLVGSPAGASVSADIAAVKAETATIVVDVGTAQADLDIITGAAGALLDSTATSAQLVDDILDEVNTGAAHNVTNSLGKQVRSIANRTAYEGTVNDASASTTVFIIDSGASAVDDFYNDQPIIFTDGALTGQTRVIFDYTGASRTVTLDEALTSAPANGVGILIGADHIHAVTEITADIDANSTQLAAIALDTGTTLPALLPAALVGGRIDADMGAISTSTTSADNLEASTTGIVKTTVNDAGASTTAFIITSSVAVDDHFNGRIITFTSGTLAGQATDITDYAGATKTVTVTALTSAPANGVSFVIT